MGTSPSSEKADVGSCRGDCINRSCGAAWAGKLSSLFSALGLQLECCDRFWAPDYQTYVEQSSGGHHDDQQVTAQKPWGLLSGKQELRPGDNLASVME